MMWFQILMLICMAPVMPIIYLMLANETKPKKNIVLGVTLPYEARTDLAVERVCKGFRKNLKISAVLLCIMPLLTFFLPWFSIVLTVYLIWLTLVIVVPHWQYVLAHRKLKRLKKENGWYSDLEGMEIVDTKAVSVTLKRLSWGWFIPPLVIGFLPFFAALLTEYKNKDWDFMLLGYGINGCLVLLMAVLHRMVYRQRTETIDLDTERSIALTRVRQYQWSKCWLWLSWLTAGFSLFFWLLIDLPWGILAVTMVYTILLLAVTLRTELVTRALQERLTADSGRIGYRDEDENWIFGMVYYNPKDRHLLVNSRIGMNTSLNLARPAGKFLMGLSLIVILAMPFLGAFCIAEEFTPLHLAVENGTIWVTHVGEAYQTPLNAVKSVEQIDVLPKHQKIAGTGLDNLLKGRFRLTGEGDARLYLNPQKGPFLRMELLNGETVILGSSDEEETETVYRAVMETLEKGEKKNAEN